MDTTSMANPTRNSQSFYVRPPKRFRGESRKAENSLGKFFARTSNKPALENACGIFDVIHNQHAIEMVHFMLYDARIHILQLLFPLLPRSIRVAHDDSFGAR